MHHLESVNVTSKRTRILLTIDDLVSEYCKVTKQWSIRLGFEGLDLLTPKFMAELVQAVPYLKDDDKLMQAVVDGNGYLFGDETYIQNLYDQTVGDDDPTKLNPYNGPMKVYALTISSTGDFMNENT